MLFLLHINKIRMESFRKLGLSEQLLNLLGKAGFSKPSEIQEEVIPLILEGKDVIGGSATGSGKTLAFGAGIIEKTEKEKGLQVLILAPTRELAEQIGEVFKKFSAYKKLSVAVVYGGVNIERQIRELRTAEIAVGTPGRILDHLERRTINFSKLRILVLDEADRMLDMGFIRDVEKIVKNCPKKRQTLLFSATISFEVEHLAKKHMINPKMISLESHVDPTKLKQIYYDVPRNMKFSLLVHLLQKENIGLVMVFCNTRHNTDFVADNLKNLGIDAIAIHGGLTQEKRNKIMQKFHEKKVCVLVCTDIAARGLDIKGVSHVYNYDIPKTSKEYIHRIGRTARAGKEGIVINILADRDYENFGNVLKDELLHIEKENIPEIKNIRINLGESRGGGKRTRGEFPQRHGISRERPRHSTNQRSGNYRGGGKRNSERKSGSGNNRNNRDQNRSPGRSFRGKRRY